MVTAKRLTWILEPLEQYLRSFSWNKVKYRADRPLAELIDLLQKVKPTWTDSSVPQFRQKQNQYS
jgi:V-type H+-transporting ATPase subunit C